MYDKKKKKWTADHSANTAYTNDEASLLRQRFEAADTALANLGGGSDNSGAVYQMEQLAKSGYPDACLAMAQLFENGWAVSKSRKQALYWYEKAAAAGSAEASAYLARLKKAKANKIALCAIVLILCVAAAALTVYVIKNAAVNSQKPNVILPKGITLIEHEDIESHGKELVKNAEQYDTQEMISGEIPANRILLVYTGDNLDLSSYHVVNAIGDDEFIVLQFENAQDAQACLDYLRTLEGTQAADLDQYYPTSAPAGTIAPTAQNYSPVYHSAESGFDYYSWGAEYMGFDKYSAYLQKILPADHHITVAVIDSGVLPQDGTKDRILDGISFFNNSKGKNEGSGHGTHVAGTIIDCTQGVNVDILPVQVFNPAGKYTNSSIVRDGVKFSMEQHVGVINMSLGGPAGVDPGDSALEYYINQAMDSGIIVVVAAGNSSADANDYFPAQIERVLTVAGIDENGDSYNHTNHGSVIDVCAPAVDVLSYYIPDGFEYLTGTSMASPHVAAMAAMMQLEFDESPDVIEFYIKSYCTRLSSDTDYFGAGYPDARLLIE